MTRKTGALSYFIPDSVSVGMFGIGCSADRAGTEMTPHTVGEYGFVTCRFRYDQWVSPGVFERLTKYKPSNQRDRAAQLRKSVDGSVSEFENGPVSGFKIVAWHANPYDFCTKDYDRSGDVVLEDPRGFMVSLGQDQFFESLKMSGGNVSGHVLSGEFVYGWENHTKGLTLVPVSHPEYPGWKKASDACRVKDRGGAAVSKKDLVPGRVYRAVKVLKGDWMYVGVVDTYSQACHADAFDNNGRYSVDEFVERESGVLREKWHTVWPTTRGKLVFYSMSSQAQQYVVRTDVSGVFSCEVRPKPDGTYAGEDGTAYMMYSDRTKPVTFENVKDDMSSSPAFTKIRFTSDPKFRPTPFGAFELDFNGVWREPRVFPFVTRSAAAIVRSGGKYVKLAGHCGSGTLRNYTMFDVSATTSLPSRGTGFVGRPASRGWGIYAGGGVPTGYVSASGLYSRLSPEYPAYEFENGKAVRPEHAVVFVPHAIRDAANELY